MKTKSDKPATSKTVKKPIGQFATEAEFLAAKAARFEEVFGKVDWEKARQDGLIS